MTDLKYSKIQIKDRIKVPDYLAKNQRFCTYGNHEDITHKTRYLDNKDFYNLKSSTCKECASFDNCYRRYKKLYECEKSEVNKIIEDPITKKLNEQERMINELNQKLDQLTTNMISLTHKFEK